jgi:hypothetical protein
MKPFLHIPRSPMRPPLLLPPVSCSLGSSSLSGVIGFSPESPRGRRCASVAPQLASRRILENPMSLQSGGQGPSLRAVRANERRMDESERLMILRPCARTAAESGPCHAAPYRLGALHPVARLPASGQSPHPKPHPSSAVHASPEVFIGLVASLWPTPAMDVEQRFG